MLLIIQARSVNAGKGANQEPAGKTKNLGKNQRILDLTET